MRGKLSHRARGLSAHGITPAHAGKTLGVAAPKCFCRDHPRACGENEQEKAGIFGEAGSPPRMRGKRARVQLRPLGQGITPAHAGKTSSRTPRTSRPRDHPRACGENRCSSPCRHPAWGSPPRMRGKLAGDYGARGRGGITPAHAGKTWRNTLGLRGAQDHPRACGENASKMNFFAAEMGSPPRMRGKHTLNGKRMLCTGITPAHAGKTRWQRPGQRAMRDHPRACGENLDGLREQAEAEGSPPRMRGKLLRLQHI